MYQRKLEPDIRCPLEYGMELFGGKWNSRIICVLATLGTLRYSALRHEMGNITDAVLATTLKKLIANGIVARTSYDEIPPRVEYSLTEKGVSVVPVLQSICQWAGIFYKDEGEAPMVQCQRCDHQRIDFSSTYPLDAMEEARRISKAPNVKGYTSMEALKKTLEE